MNPACKFALVSIFGLLLSGCDAKSGELPEPLPGSEELGTLPSEPTAPAGDARQSLADIEALIADKSCVTDSDCAVAGAGHRPCGGPEQYLVYSRSQVDLEKLEEALFAHTEVRRKQNEGRMGNCMALMPPQAKCLENQCRAISPVDSLQ